MQVIGRLGISGLARKNRLNRIASLIVMPSSLKNRHAFPGKKNARSFVRRRFTYTPSLNGATGIFLVAIPGTVII